MSTDSSSQSAPENTQLSYWQLLNGVARDLDLMLQDLGLEYEGGGGGSGQQDGCTSSDEFAALERSFTGALLLEQFVRGVGDEVEASSELPSGIYRSSQQPFLNGEGSYFDGSDDEARDDDLDGREAPSTPPSPAPPVPPQFAAPSSPPLPSALGDGGLINGAATSGGGGDAAAADSQSTLVTDVSSDTAEDCIDGSTTLTGNLDDASPCDIGILERLVRTHHIWFLPGIGRAGAVHLLQGKEVGNFIVRQSSKQNTMALSVRLPEQLGPYIEHYLIETVGDGKLRLEGSDNHFDAIPMLVAHYCQCCDELPVTLTLPRALAQAAYRHELSSLALLGQDFWVSSLIQSPSAGGSLSSLPANRVIEPAKPATTVSTFKPPPPAPPPDTAKPTSPPTSPENGCIAIAATVPPLPPRPPSSTSPIPQQQLQSAGAPKLPPRSIPPPPPPRTLPLNTTSRQLQAQQQVVGGSNAEAYGFFGDDARTPVSSPFGSTESILKKKHPMASSSLSLGSVAESPVFCYHSSLADKISDYEDIWATPTKPSPMPACKEVVSQETQTDSITLVDEFGHYESGGRGAKFGAQVVSPALTADSGIGAHTDDNDTLDKKWTQQLHLLGTNQFSSPFYSEPVDSLMASEQGMNKPAARWAQDDHSDRPPSLFSSLDSIPQVACPQQPVTVPKVTDASAQARIGNGVLPDPAALSSNKKDSATQVSCPDISKKGSRRKKKKQKQQVVKKEASWKVDSSWEWMGNSDSSEDDDDDDLDEGMRDDAGGFFPIEYAKGGSQHSEVLTVEDLILQKSPQLRIPEIKPLTQSNLMRVSEYDNLGYCTQPPPPTAVSGSRKPMAVLSPDHQSVNNNSDIGDDAATEFSEPWDSLRWDRLLRLVIPENEAAAGYNRNKEGDDADEQKRMVCQNNDRNRMKNGSAYVGEAPSESASMLSITSEVTSTEDGDLNGGESTSLASDFPSVTLERERSKSFQERLEPYLTKQRIIALRNREASSVGENIRQYIFRLSQEGNNTFAKAIENFIQCTKDSNEANPAVVMRNIRQFMTGMKNYLLKHGEGQFDQLVQQERSKLRSNEFLNIDAIIEGALHKLVIKPLKNFLYQLFVNEYSKNGSLKLLSDSIRQAREKTPEEMGIRPEFQPPHGAAMEVVRHFLLRLQQAYSPLKKLENLLAAISTIYNSVQEDKKSHGKEHASLGADDFLPIFIYVLVHCGMISAEIEADYMWGLLHPSLLSGEGGYYLTTLSSAVHVLKSFTTSAAAPTQQQQDVQRHRTNSFHHTQQQQQQQHTANDPTQADRMITQHSPEPRLPSIADLQGFMKIMIPDEITGNIISKTLPVRPNMTTKEVCKMIAHKFKITNPQDYGLFQLTKGEETQLNDSDCPQTIKADLMTSGVECMFAYKRCDARFVWPVLDQNNQ